MNKTSPKIPAVEEPVQPDTPNLNLEESTLDKRAKSAAFRDVIERIEHKESLNARIAVLQDKLNKAEEELRHFLPRTAELEHAMLTAKMNTGVGWMFSVAGGLSLAFSSFVKIDSWKWICFASGVSLVVCSLAIGAVTRMFNWPKNATEQR